MKFLITFLAVILLSGCQSQTAEKGGNDHKTDLVKQWLTWEGNSKLPHIVFISGDEEYRSEEALPQLAKILSIRHGFKCTVLFAQNPESPGIINPNYAKHIPGLEQLEFADLMIIFTRFRALPDDQMQFIDDYLKSGKPVLGMRTATHAFRFEGINVSSNFKHYGNYFKDENEWKDGFGRLVLGEHWIDHQGAHGKQSTKGIIAPKAKNHPIVNGIQDGEIWGPTDVYKVRLPLPGDAQPIIVGQVTEGEGEISKNDLLFGMRPTDDKLPGLKIENINGKKTKVNQNDPMMPVAWTKTYQIPGGKPGKCFTTTMGASTDLLAEGTRRMLVNAVFWCLDKPVPAKANVEFVGSYKPSRFTTHSDVYWDEKNLLISNIE